MYDTKLYLSSTLPGQWLHWQEKTHPHASPCAAVHFSGFCSLLGAGTQLLSTLNWQAAAGFLKSLMSKFKQSSSRHLFSTLPLLCCCRAITLCVHPVCISLHCSVCRQQHWQKPINKVHTARENICSSTEQICPKSAFASGCSRLVQSCCLGCKYPMQILALTAQKSCTLLTKI